MADDTQARMVLTASRTNALARQRIEGLEAERDRLTEELKGLKASISKLGAWHKAMALDRDRYRDEAERLQGLLDQAREALDHVVGPYAGLAIDVPLDDAWTPVLTYRTLKRARDLLARLDNDEGNEK